jgi:hypothetical protein
MKRKWLFQVFNCHLFLIERVLKFLWLSYLFNSQIWLNLFMDDHQSATSQDWEPKTLMLGSLDPSLNTLPSSHQFFFIALRQFLFASKLGILWSISSSSHYAKRSQNVLVWRHRKLVLAQHYCTVYSGWQMAQYPRAPPEKSVINMI